MKRRGFYLAAWAVFCAAYGVAYMVVGRLAGSDCIDESGTACSVAAYWEAHDDSRTWGWIPFWGPLLLLIGAGTILTLVARPLLVSVVALVGMAWLGVQLVATS